MKNTSTVAFLALTFTTAALLAADDYQLGPDSQPSRRRAAGEGGKACSAHQPHLSRSGSRLLGLCAGIELSPDQTLLYIADTRGRFVWSWQVQPDGKLAHGQRYFHLHEKDEAMGRGADGLALDTEGRLYVCTALGIQYCDQAGRVNGILNLPPNKRAANLCFGGAKMDTLYVCAGDKVYRRVTQAKGVRSADAPQKPTAPRL